MLLLVKIEFIACRIVLYATGIRSAIQAIVDPPPLGRVTHVIILEGTTMPGGQDNAVIVSETIQGIFPSVMSPKYAAIRPKISLVHRRGENCLTKPIPGVDGVSLHMKLGDEARLAQMLSDSFVSCVNLPSVSARSAIRDFEGARSYRSALKDPFWMANLVHQTYVHLPDRDSEDRMCFPELSSEARLRLAAYIDDWDFYAPSLGPSELLHVVELIFERFHLFTELEIQRDRFHEFLLVITLNYHDNPYHNLHHAVDVLQCCYYVLRLSMMLRRMFRPVDIMALFVAALCHDIGHPSFNNPFSVEHESLVAWLYNDHAVLENMHSTMLFAILRNPRYNFVSHWPRSQWKEFRSLMVASILGTDMSQHFQFIRQFQGIDGAFARALRCLNQGEAGPIVPEDRKLLAVAVIKFADICNVVRPFHSAKKWGFHLVCEFFHQGDWERILGYQNTPMTFRSLPDLARGQQYFLNNVAGPLYKTIGEYFSELHFAEDSLKANLEAWRAWRPETDQEIQSYIELYPADRERHHSH